MKTKGVADVQDGEDQLLSQVDVQDPATRTLQRGERSPVVVAGASFISINRGKKKKAKKVKKGPKEDTALFLPSTIFRTNRRSRRDMDSKPQENVAEKEVSD